MGEDGTKEAPWILKTPSGQSEIEAYRDEAGQALVVQVGKTEVRYQLRCIEDLHRMLVEHADWMPLGNADEQKPRWRAPSKTGPGRSPTRLAAGTG